MAKGASRVGSGSGGPYGPSNPPPPPPGLPPRKASGPRGSDSSSVLPPPQGSASAQRPDRHLTRGERRRFHRQRLKARQEAGRERSRSPSADRTGDRNDESAYRERSPMSRGNTRAQPLREARQYTPNQIIDETYGRLSGGTNFGDQHQEQSGGRSSWAPDSGSGGNTGQFDHPRGRSPMGVPHGAASSNGYDRYTSEQAPNSCRQANARPGSHSEGNFSDLSGATTERGRNGFEQAGKGISYQGPPVNRDYDVEDEVIWDDEEPSIAADAIQNPAMLAPADSSHHRAARPEKAQWPTEERRKRPNSHARTPKNTSRGFPRHRHDYLVIPEAKAGYPDMTKTLQGPPVPASVYNLRKYDARVTAMHQNLPRHERFLHGNGKVGPFVYGSMQGMDLGLCYATFCTRFRCEMGVKCAWRHHPLTTEERDWILSYGRERGRQFLDESNSFWPLPEVPVPGACMHDK